MPPLLSGESRIPHHADSLVARLDPEEHLRPNRHGEWSGALSGANGLPAGPRWGVSLVPHGMDEATADPALMAAIRSQHAR